MSMGFPDADGNRAALNAARGNVDLAVEFLMNGIPDTIPLATPPPSTGVSTPLAEGGSGDLEQLRNHPQFNQLKRLVQANPAALGQVLEAIGQQDPALLAIIHSNHAAFVAMMNEPIVEAPAPAGAGFGFPGAPGGMPAGAPNFAQVIQGLMALPEAQRNSTATAMGMSPDQLRDLMQVANSIPPEQLQQALAGMAGMGGAPPGAGVIRMSPEELAAVRRLQELGFSEQQVSLSYLVLRKLFYTS